MPKWNLNLYKRCVKKNFIYLKYFLIIIFFRPLLYIFVSAANKCVNETRKSFYFKILSATQNFVWFSWFRNNFLFCFLIFLGHESDRGAVEAGRGHRGAAAGGARVAAPERCRPRQTAPQTPRKGENFILFKKTFFTQN